MEEFLTWDRGAAGSSLTGVTALCPWARQIYISLVLVQPRKTRPYITERLLMGRKESNQNKIREPFHFEVFIFLQMKNMESKSTSGVTSTYHIKYIQQLSCMCSCACRSHPIMTLNWTLWNTRVPLFLVLHIWHWWIVKECFGKVNFEKNNQQATKTHAESGGTRCLNFGLSTFLLSFAIITNISLYF